MNRKPEPAKSYDETISQNGFRFTEQRRQVYDVLMGNPDHPTAVEVFMRVKNQDAVDLPGDSLQLLGDAHGVWAPEARESPSRAIALLPEFERTRAPLL